MIYRMTFTLHSELIDVSYDTDDKSWTFHSDNETTGELREFKVLETVGEIGEPPPGLPVSFTPVNSVTQFFNAKLTKEPFEFNPEVVY